MSGLDELATLVRQFGRRVRIGRGGEVWVERRDPAPPLRECSTDRPLQGRADRTAGEQIESATVRPEVVKEIRTSIARLARVGEECVKFDTSCVSVETRVKTDTVALTHGAGAK